MMAADCIVIPRALSAGRKSVTVEPSSTSGQFVRHKNNEQTVKEMGNVQVKYRWSKHNSLRIKIKLTLPPILRV